MRGLLKDGAVIVERSQKLMKRRFGEIRGDDLILTPEEAAYLTMKGILQVYDKERILSFEDLLSISDAEKYFVFEDLRERGIRADIRHLEDFVPLHESSRIDVSWLHDLSGRKIAVVDSEGEVSYFAISIFEGRGKHEESIAPFEARFFSGFFVTDFLDLHRKYFYGTERAGRVLLSVYEGLYLIERGIMRTDNSFNQIRQSGMRYFENFDITYRVYRDLRERGFMVKTGLKFGSDFRVYERIRSLREMEHSRYLVKIKTKLIARDVAGDVRLSNAVKKILLYPFFTDNGNIIYISIRRVKP